MSEKKKLFLGIMSLTSCEGCQFAILDKFQEFLNVTRRVNLVEMRLLKENNSNQNKDVFDASNISKTKKFDVVFIEGSPITKENIDDLKILRRKAKKIVALGACACLGGIYHLKNYYPRDYLLSQIYPLTSHIDNPLILPLDKIIQIDAYLPGCPVNAAEFFLCLEQLILGKDFVSKNIPVCDECQKNGYECVLQAGEPCLGPITLGGCGAVCLKSKMFCMGCRGLRANPETANLLKILKKQVGAKRLEQILEMFGLKDKIGISPK